MAASLRKPTFNSGPSSSTETDDEGVRGTCDDASICKRCRGAGRAARGTRCASPLAAARAGPGRGPSAWAAVVGRPFAAGPGRRPGRALHEAPLPWPGRRGLKSGRKDERGARRRAGPAGQERGSPPPQVSFRWALSRSPLCRNSGRSGTLSTPASRVCGAGTSPGPRPRRPRCWGAVGAVGAAASRREAGVSGPRSFSPVLSARFAAAPGSGAGRGPRGAPVGETHPAPTYAQPGGKGRGRHAVTAPW